MKRIMIISALLLSTVFIITPDTLAQEETKTTNQNTAENNRLTRAERKAARIEKRNTKAQDHNSTRSNKTASRVDNSGSTGGDEGGTKAQDHNSTRSNKTASVVDNSGSTGGDGSGNKAQDHNSTRSNKTASVVDNSGSTGGDGSGTKGQDHNSTRSNKTASVVDNSGSTGGDGSGNKAQDHNSTRSNKTASRVDNSGPAGGGRNEFIFSLATGYSMPMGVSAAEEDLLFRSGGFSGKMSADYFFGSFGIGLTNGFMVSKADESAFYGYMESMGYDDTNAAISTADGNSGYLLIGPVFQTGGRFSISIDGRVGLFVSSPASVSGVIKGEGVSIMSVSGSGKSISPGLSAGASFRYAISDRLSLGIGTEYAGTKTGVTYYDGKTGQITTKKVSNQHLTTAVTFSISCGR